MILIWRIVRFELLNVNKTPYKCFLTLYKNYVTVNDMHVFYAKHCPVNGFATIMFLTIV